MSQGEIVAIVDASALFPLLRKVGGKATEYLTKLAILDLTKYEIGDAVWKEYKRGALKNWKRVIESWSVILEEMLKLSISEEELKDVERIAIEKDLTFYDASYIFLSESRNLKLVTEDVELLNAYKNTTNLENFLEAIT